MLPSEFSSILLCQKNLLASQTRSFLSLKAHLYFFFLKISKLWFWVYLWKRSNPSLLKETSTTPQRTNRFLLITEHEDIVEAQLIFGEQIRE
jgi:hypothetical protein